MVSLVTKPGQTEVSCLHLLGIIVQLPTPEVGRAGLELLQQKVFWKISFSLTLPRFLGCQERGHSLKVKRTSTIIKGGVVESLRLLQMTVSVSTMVVPEAEGVPLLAPAPPARCPIVTPRRAAAEPPSTSAIPLVCNLVVRSGSSRAGT